MKFPHLPSVRAARTRIAAAILLSTFYFLLSSPALAFTGPGAGCVTPPGTCEGSLKSDTSGNAAIGGAATTTYKLYIYGQSAATATTSAPTLSGTTSVCIAGDCRTAWPTGGGAGTVLGSGTANYIPLWLTTATLTNSLIYQTAGNNIGIGTTSPAYKLSVSGDIQATGSLYGSYAGTLGAANVSSGSFGSNTGGGNYTFPASLTVDTSTLYVDAAADRVGIGTTGPGLKLDVVGDIRSSAKSDSAGSAGMFLGSVSEGSFWDLRRTTTGNNLAIDNYTGSAWNNAITVLSTNGNVGIGTTGPGAPLEIFGTGGAKLRLSSDYATDEKWQFDVDSGGIYLNRVAGTGGSTGQLVSVLTSGNLGIGTTTPGYKLDVQGGDVNTSGVFRKGGTSGASISCSAGQTIATTTVSGGIITGGTCVSLGGGSVGGSGTLNYVSKWTPDGSTLGNSLIYDNGTNVGIGTTSPSVKLHVSGDITSTGTVTGGTLSGTYTGTISSANVSSGAFGSNTGGGNYSFPANLTVDTNTLFVDATANRVGIGTTTPNADLDVVNASSSSIIRAKSTSGGLALLQLDSSNIGSAIDFNNDGLYKGEILYYHPDNYMSFHTNSSEKVRITSTGNVGIGTTTPGYKLDVASAGSTTARFGATSTDTVIVGGGAGKLDVGTVDPVYRIGAVKYATYMAGMTGVKEETAATIKLSRNDKCLISNSPNAYCAVIDFDKVERGSDLWLFYQATDFGKNWENLTALLTPNFDGKVWYEKDPVENRLILRAILPSTFYLLPSDPEVSYRLTAPRFDYANWGNGYKGESEGLTVPEK